MPACFRHNQQISGGEFESFNLVIHNNIEFSGAGDDVYQLVTGWMAFPTGVAVEIDIGILEIAFAEGGKGLKYFLFRRVSSSIHDWFETDGQLVDINDFNHEKCPSMQH